MTRPFAIVALLALAGGAACPLPGCAATPPARGENAIAADGLTQSAAAIRQASDQLGRTLASLERVRAMEGELPTLFAEYRANLEALEALASRVDATSRRMRADAEAFFDTWNQQLAAIENVAIRDRSEQRRQLVERSLRGLLVDYGRLSDDSGRFLGDLRDIRSALTVDLTPGGVASVADLMQAAAGRGRTVMDAAARVADTFESLGVNMGGAAAG